MRIAPIITLSKDEEDILTVLSQSNTVLHRALLRSKIILLASQGMGNDDISRMLNTTPSLVSRWRRRFATDGLKGIERDAPRSGRPKSITPLQVQEVLHTFHNEKPPNGIRWSIRSLAKRLGMTRASVHETLRTHGHSAHSGDDRRALDRPSQRKLMDVVGLHATASEHTIVFLARHRWSEQKEAARQLILPQRFIRDHTGCFEEKRGSSDLPGLLKLMDEKLRESCLKQHRLHEFSRLLSFLEQIDEATPQEHGMYAVLDTYTTCRSPLVKLWLARHPRWQFYFTENSSAWMTTVENWLHNMSSTKHSQKKTRTVAILSKKLAESLSTPRTHVKSFSWKVGNHGDRSLSVRHRQHLPTHILT